MKLRRFWMVFAGACLIIIALFLLFEQAGVELSLDAHANGPGSWFTALAGITLLIVDVVLPVPSSVVMIAFGKLFGALPGALLSVLGCTGAAIFGSLLGRLGKDAFRRYISPEEHERAEALLDRFGLLAIAATRPVPVLAEAVALIAGASGYGLTRCALAAAVGSTPAAVLYAWAGAQQLSASSDVLIFALVLLVSLVFWLLGRSKRATHAG